MADFIHIHNHSEYSLLDGANKIKNLVDLAVKHDMPAIALTDHGNMTGAVEFATECKSAGIKPLVGVEAYTSGDRPRTGRDKTIDKENHNLILIAQNETGYRNLLKLTSRANTEGFYYKPRIDHELLSQYSDGIIATSACLGSEICQYLLEGDYDHALRTAATYRDILTPERFFIEMQDHGQEDDKIVNPQLLTIADELGLMTIVTNDIHYAAKADANPHDTLLCIGTNARKFDAKRMRYPGEEFYFKTYEQMLRLFPDNPEALHNTALIADMVDFELKTGDMILPHFDVPLGETHDTWFEKCCWEGAKKRWPELQKAHRDRIAYEIEIIKYKGYSAYFLIVADFVRWAHERGIPARCRGSAAGSVVAYVLGISNIDPMKYDLMFERFFYKERITPPDIDLDFADYRRHEVVDYCREKYGKDHRQHLTELDTDARAGILHNN